MLSGGSDRPREFNAFVAELSRSALRRLGTGGPWAVAYGSPLVPTTKEPQPGGSGIPKRKRWSKHTCGLFLSMQPSLARR
jgi:hypothetical protein